MNKNIEYREEVPNHTLPIEHFEEEIKLMVSEGFNPIGVTIIMLENTYIFGTEEEAYRAYDKFELGARNIQAWWYGQSDFKDAVKLYEEDINSFTTDNTIKYFVDVLKIDKTKFE